MAMFSFNRRKREIELRSVLGRIIDVTSPNITPPEGDCRIYDRFNRTMPVLLTPWENGRPSIGESANAITKDISDQGVAVILPQPFRCQEVVVGFWLRSSSQVATGDAPSFCLGQVRQSVQIGGGFWQLGIELTELVNVSDSRELELLVPVAANLLPPCDRSPAPAEALS
jgi:hypothetical protein